MKTSREQLMLVAFRLFLEHGYEATTMNQLARAAGLSKGSFHHHFSRKPDLYEACIDYFFTRYLPVPGSLESSVGTRDWVIGLARGFGALLDGFRAEGIELASYYRFLLGLPQAQKAEVSTRIKVVKAELMRRYGTENPGTTREMGERWSNQVVALTEGLGWVAAWETPPVSVCLADQFASAAEALMVATLPAKGA